MNYLQFIHEKPVLIGYIKVGNKIKYGMFQPKWSKYSNSIAYIYYTMKGYRGTGGFTLNRAYYLLKTGALQLK